MRYYVVSVSGGSDQPPDLSGRSGWSGAAVIQGDGYETREAAEHAVREMERSLREDPVWAGFRAVLEARGEPYPTHRIIEAESQADLIRQQLRASGVPVPSDLPDWDD